MKLLAYMRANSLTPDQMAEKIGDVSEGHVRKLMYGERMPSLVVLARITEATKGEVTVNDFMPEPTGASTERAA